MAKGINHFGALQQKTFLNAKIQEALNAHKSVNDGMPFEYRHYGFLYPKVKQIYEKMGFTLTWHNEDKNNMYWSFMTPKESQIINEQLK